MQLQKSHLLWPLFDLAEREPDRQIITFVDENGKDAKARTASQLAEQTIALANYLRDGCGLNKGDVALLLYPPSMEFVDCYAACLLAGVVAAPLYPPNLARPKQDLERLASITSQSKAKAILTCRNYRWAQRISATKEVLSGSKARWPNLPWYVTEGLGRFANKKPLLVESNETDLAILQFTSGSTATPKGVRLTHKNIAHQLAFNKEALGFGPDARLVMWVPQYHDLGLISGITAVCHGLGSLWFMSPLDFLAKPALWFDVVHRVRATHTAAPNFGYAHVTKKTTAEQRASWDLSSLRVCLNAAEPVVPRTVDEFYSAFAISNLSPKSFCPGYGLAEHAVGVTIGGQKRVKIDRDALIKNQLAKPSDSGDLELIGCGKISFGIKVKIVDPKTSLCVSDHGVGEIWVQSPSVADGYEGQKEISEQTFGATLQNEDGRWLRTGDLGFMHDGELYVTGRQKDLIILRGSKLHPEDLEEVIRHAHPGIRAAGVAAFSVPSNASEELVVIVEVQDPNAADKEEIAAAIKKSIAEGWRVPATVALVAPRTVKKTTSGKIKRAACKQAWIAGELNPLMVATPNYAGPKTDLAATSLRKQLIEVGIEDRVDWLLSAIGQIAEQQFGGDASSIAPDDFLPDHGLDSLQGSELLTELEDRLDAKLPTTLFIEHPTLRGAAIRILGELGFDHIGQMPQMAPEKPMPFRPAPRAMLPAQTKIGIVGAGVGGLVSALELAKLGYKNIEIFEASNDFGGKVMTMHHGKEIFEMGQVFFADSFRTVIELAMELKLELKPVEGDLLPWDEGGFEEPLAAAPGRKWLKSMTNAAKIELNPQMPFPSMYSNFSGTWASLRERHRLGTPHPLFTFDWNAMGYGFDGEIPAAYILAYFSVIAASGASCYLANGNQQLWQDLARHLEKDWGVKIHRNSLVAKVLPGENSVSLSCNGNEHNFDEVILAIPPTALTKVLPENDPLQTLLGSVEHYAYSVRTFRATGLPQEGAMFMPTLAQQVGRTMVMQACKPSKEWFFCGQYASSHGQSDNPLSDAELKAELEKTVSQMGGQVLEHGPTKVWTYFPHIRKDPVATLQQAEALQGTRHLWATGSWISFETTEHVARHARHLIRTCFDPAG